MKKTMLLASAAMIGGFLAAHANAQGVPQTVDIAKVDVQKVAAGYRASKVIGSNVLNEANETIGKIDDLLVTRDGKEPYAVLSIGGFLGMGTHMVVVPYDSLTSRKPRDFCVAAGCRSRAFQFRSCCEHL
jgi:hypothetical protein